MKPNLAVKGKPLKVIYPPLGRVDLEGAMCVCVVRDLPPTHTYEIWIMGRQVKTKNL